MSQTLSSLFVNARTLGEHDARAATEAPFQFSALAEQGYASADARAALQDVASGYLAGALSGLTQQDVAGRLQTIHKVGKRLAKEKPGMTVYKVKVQKSKYDGALSATVIIATTEDKEWDLVLFTSYANAGEAHARLGDFKMARGAVSLAKTYAKNDGQKVQLAALCEFIDRAEATILAKAE